MNQSFKRKIIHFRSTKPATVACLPDMTIFVVMLLLFFWVNDLLGLARLDLILFAVIVIVFYVVLTSVIIVQRRNLDRYFSRPLTLQDRSDLNIWLATGVRPKTLPADARELRKYVSKCLYLLMGGPLSKRSVELGRVAAAVLFVAVIFITASLFTEDHDAVGHEVLHIAVLLALSVQNVLIGIGRPNRVAKFINRKSIKLHRKVRRQLIDEIANESGRMPQVDNLSGKGVSNA